MHTERGTRSIFDPLVISLNHMPSRLMARQINNIMRRIETAITLSARLIWSSMPVTFRLLSRETFPLNLIPGVDADKAMVSGTMTFCFNSVAPTASGSVEGTSPWALSGAVGPSGATESAGIFAGRGCRFGAGVVINNHKVVL